ncbi:DUF6173 family protein [Gemmobacter nectariphilus]|uniref:DUF6173 family protein n=1 Tax=Gemmobacter nectariphilus TaxID=220343 RepID=UPI0004144540
MNGDDILTSAEVHEASALDAMRGLARCAPPVPGAAPTVEQEPLPEALTREPPEAKSPARWAYERVLLYLRNFESQLDAQHEVALGFAGSDAGVLRIEGLGFFDPDILTFYGQGEDGARTQLIQHVSQLNVMLRAVRKESPPEEPPRRIGFRLDEGPAA